VNPPRGIVPTLESSLRAMKIKQAFCINTFGYGFNLLSDLLADIAKVGGGLYGYIPGSQNIKFIFSFPQKKLTQLIDSSTILILPSAQESFGLVLLESWARGKPVITSNIPPLLELVKK
jgi:glycosyltransferase involved in cell wall biosynthesis